MYINNMYNGKMDNMMNINNLLMIGALSLCTMPFSQEKRKKEREQMHYAYVCWFYVVVRENLDGEFF